MNVCEASLQDQTSLSFIGLQDVGLVSDCCGDNCGFVPRAGMPYKLFIQVRLEVTSFLSVNGTSSSSRCAIACHGRRRSSVLHLVCRPPSPSFPSAALQTAGFSRPQDGAAELMVYCVRDPEGLRAKVLAAKRALINAGGGAGGGAAATGAGKDDERLINPLSSAVGAVGLGAAASMSGAQTAQVVAVLERIERAINEGLTEIRRQGSSSSAAGAGAGKQGAVSSSSGGVQDWGQPPRKSSYPSLT